MFFPVVCLRRSQKVRGSARAGRFGGLKKIIGGQQKNDVFDFALGRGGESVGAPRRGGSGGRAKSMK